MARDHAVIGAVGEQLVLSRLLSRGILAAKVPDGTSVVDLVVHQTGLNGELRIHRVYFSPIAPVVFAPFRMASDTPIAPVRSVDLRSAIVRSASRSVV